MAERTGNSQKVCAPCKPLWEKEKADEYRAEHREEARQRTMAWLEIPGNRDASNERRRQWHLDNLEADRAQKRDYYWANHEAVRAQNRVSVRAHRAKLRTLVIAAYGSRCNCPGCHVVHAALLTVDHVNGDAHHRKARRNRSTGDFYRWLVRRGFPSDYQLLCGSCNLAKGDRPRCPLAGQDH